MRRIGGTHQAGFTVLELMVCIGLVATLLAVSTIILRPQDFGPQQRNAKRWLGVAQLMQAITAYQASHDTLPDGISNKAQALGSASDQLNLCTTLVPAYIKDMPVDPLFGYEVSDTKTCTGDAALYATDYIILSTSSHQVTIMAPGAELQQQISVTRQF
ncbi:MAG TPA: type II secretion system protein [Candidatus Saccharimonadales bacterium]|nr:type II secretion system protein [Candidatus Saccharimonadales bacterium]